MNKFRKMAITIASAIITASMPMLHLNADENYIISADDSRYKYLENTDGTISIAASEYSKLGIKGEVELPSVLDGKTVTGICKNGFSGEELTKVTVPDTICSIDSLAFANCLTLSQVILPDNITHMGELAFSNTGFESSLLSEADTDFAVIDDYILYLYKGSDINIEIPDGVKVIANSAFANNGAYSSEEIASVTMPDGVAYIGDNAFENCDSLKKMIIKTGLASVGENAINSNITIYGYIGTYAQEFAEANGNLFVPIISEGKYQIECDYETGYKKYYFSTDTEFSKDGIHVYKRNYDGTREEITDWEFDSTPAELYAASNPTEETTEATTVVTVTSVAATTSTTETTTATDATEE